MKVNGLTKVIRVNVDLITSIFMRNDNSLNSENSFSLLQRNFFIEEESIKGTLWQTECYKSGLLAVFYYFSTADQTLSKVRELARAEETNLSGPPIEVAAV